MTGIALITKMYNFSI